MSPLFLNILYIVILVLLIVGCGILTDAAVHSPTKKLTFYNGSGYTYIRVATGLGWTAVAGLLIFVVLFFFNIDVLGSWWGKLYMFIIFTLVTVSGTLCLLASNSLTAAKLTDKNQRDALVSGITFIIGAAAILTVWIISFFQKNENQMIFTT